MEITQYMQLIPVLILLTQLRRIGANASRNSTEMLNAMLQKVDPRIRPGIHGDAVSVNCSFYIISFGSISEIDMDFTMDIYMREVWRDERLVFPTDHPNIPVNVAPRVMDQFWTPDIFFPNEKQAEFHEVTVPNKMMRVFSNGTIIYSVRITLKISCPMILTHFPMDTQECFFKVESYSHETSDLLLFWSSMYAIEVNEDLQLPQFNLMSVETMDCKKQYSTGNYPCLQARFTLQRQFGFYLLQTYVPSMLIVVLSWVSFWINLEAVPARISLGVTTVLTMATQLSGSRASIPKVSYPKAIDVWMAMCMIFVFGALLEYAFVNVMARTSHDQYKKTDDVKDKEERALLKANKNSKNDAKDDTEKGSSSRRLCPGKCTSNNAAQVIDKTSRVLFPGVFFVFNIAYWSIYMAPRE